MRYHDGLSFHSILTSIQYHIWLDVTGGQRGEELCEKASESIIVPSALLVQTVVKVQAKIETAAVDNQTTVPELHVLEEVSVPLHIGGQTLDTHGTSGPGKTRNEKMNRFLLITWLLAPRRVLFTAWLLGGRVDQRICRCQK